MKLYWQKKLFINTMTGKYGVKYCQISFKINATRVIKIMIIIILTIKKITIQIFIQIFIKCIQTFIMKVLTANCMQFRVDKKNNQQKINT